MEFEEHGDPADAAPEPTRLPTNSSGQLRLTHWAIGVVNDMSLARNCAQALEEEGIAAQDICIVPGATALQQLKTAQQLEQAENVLERVLDEVGDAVKQAEPVRDDLETAARAGHIFLGIHVPDSNQIDAIRNTLDEQQVHHLYLFEPTMITRLT
ncbi:MAG: hypothetical protein ACLQUY_23885 [Ktedonobacterales bacterium]